MPFPEGAPAHATAAFDQKVGRNVRETFGHATVANWPHIVSAPFPSVLALRSLPVLPRTLQSFRLPLAANPNPQAYREFVENFETWDEALRIWRISPDARGKLFDPIASDVVNMRIMPRFVDKNAGSADSKFPDREFELRVIDLSVNLNGRLKPILDMFGMKDEPRVTSVGDIEVYVYSVQAQS